MQRIGLGGMKLPVLALSFGTWDRKAKGERNETAGWPERNGMNGSTLARVAEAGADNERNVTKGGGTKCSPRV